MVPELEEEPHHRKKNSLSEVKEIIVASPFSSMLIFFRDRGGRAMY
jgi:hypothetical protein